MLEIDLRDAVDNPEIKNFSVLLFRLMFMADGVNLKNLGSLYPEHKMLYDRYADGDCKVFACLYDDDNEDTGIYALDNDE